MDKLSSSDLDARILTWKIFHRLLNENILNSNSQIRKSSLIIIDTWLKCLNTSKCSIKEHFIFYFGFDLNRQVDSENKDTMTWKSETSVNCPIGE